MKIIFLAFAIAVNIYSHEVYGAATTTAHPPHELEDYVKNKCFENSHNKYAFVNLDEALRGYPECKSQAVHKPMPHPVEEHDEFCRFFKESGYYSCFKNIADNVLPCLDKSEIYFPHMILKAYNTTFNNLCGTSGLMMTEYIFDTLERNKECLQNSYWTILSNEECYKNLTVYKNIMENVVDLNKRDYCSDMESFISCTTGVIEHTCEEDFSLIISYITDLFLNVCEKA